MSKFDFIPKLKKKLGVKTDATLASKMGVQPAAVLSWKKRTKQKITVRMLVALVANVRKATIKESHISSIRTIVEFFRIDDLKYKNKENYSLFDPKDGHKEHPYLAGLKEQLESKHGIYVYFDSRGRAIYIGKAERQTLWREMNNAFNRDRKSLQTIKRVNHPSSRVVYKTNEEKNRQIHGIDVFLHEIASYFSAYEVSAGMINEIEALLVRCGANDLLNKKMEKFTRPN